MNMIRYSLFLGILLILSLSLVFCGSEISDSRCKSDLEKGLSLFGTVEDIQADKPVSVKESISSGSKDLLYIPFSAKVRLKEDVRNYVHHAQEGRYHREYVGWVMQNSVNKSGTEKLLHFSLLANLSSSRWYDAKSGQIIPLKGVLRYKKEGSEWVSLGAFDN